jgi:hypothetical protein
LGYCTLCHLGDEPWWFRRNQPGADQPAIARNHQECRECGGIQFSWIDEWLKRTWITDPIDNIAESRILWHNVAAAEQNYGLVSFDKTIQKETLITKNAMQRLHSLMPKSTIAFLNWKSD